MKIGFGTYVPKNNPLMEIYDLCIEKVKTLREMKMSDLSYSFVMRKLSKVGVGLERVTVEAEN